jgi:hypothetical protein
VIDAMNNLLQAALAKAPQCMTNFVTSQVNLALLSPQLPGSHAINYAIACPCGNEELNLEAARRKDLRGTCRQEEVITPIAPVYVSCPHCQRHTLLFDPLLHGWRAQMNKDSDSDDALRLIKCTARPCKVYVRYAYNNPAKYQELVAAGVTNLEECFSSFAVLVSSRAGDNLRELLQHDCT